VNTFGWNLEHSEYVVGGWHWQILGAIRTVATAGEPGKILCCFSQVSNARFHRLPIGQISRNLNTTSQLVSRWKPLKQNFENFTVRGRFSKKSAKISKISVLFFAGKQRTISPTSHRPNFTKFEHNKSIGFTMKTFETEFEKFYRKGSFFQKKRKNF